MGSTGGASGSPGAGGAGGDGTGGLGGAAGQGAGGGAGSAGSASPGGSYACGAITCQKGVEYCVIILSDVPGIPDGNECFPMPSVCEKLPTPSCDCLAKAPCGEWCAEVDGGFVLTCPGG